MHLYFSPMACSLASRIAAYEGGLPVRFERVDLATKTYSGGDYRSVNPLGKVPALRTDAGEVLTENVAVLAYLAACAPGGLGDGVPLERARLDQWLSFVASELHARVFSVFFGSPKGEELKRQALRDAPSRLARVNAHLADREFLLERFSVADAYLFAVLNWALVTPVSLERFEHLSRYRERLLGRPSVARAFDEEYAMYRAERAPAAASGAPR